MKAKRRKRLLWHERQMEANKLHNFSIKLVAEQSRYFAKERKGRK